MSRYQNLLTIAIPTYNRSSKLIRLLEILLDEINLNNLPEVKIIISDNCSTDDTETKVNNYLIKNSNIKYFRQKSNLGFDNNILFLYNKCNSEYIWFFSDDDYPFVGSLKRVHDGLLNNKPDIILFSFMQPPGSKKRQFNFSEKIKVINDSAEIITNVLAMPKLTIYVLKKTLFNETLNKIHISSIGEGWMFLMLALSVLESSINSKVAIFSDQLATSDDDFKHIWIPTPFLYIYKIAKHPFIKKNQPKLEYTLKASGYYQCILFSWAIKVGALTVDDNIGLNKFIEDLDFRFFTLAKKPKIFFMLLLMKADLVPFLLTLKRSFNKFYL